MKNKGVRKSDAGKKNIGYASQAGHNRVFCYALSGIILLNIFIYVQSLSGGFIWDDKSLILQNPYVQNNISILKVFAWPLTIFGENYGYYRPLSMISLWFDNIVWSGNPTGFHVINMILHLGVIICLAFLLKHILGPQQAILVSFVFSTFAVHVENVAFVSGRMDILATLFMLFSLLIYFINNKKYTMRIAISCFFLILGALLSKELAFIYPIIFIVFILFSFPRKDWLTHIKRGVFCVGGAFLFYFALRILLISALTPPIPISANLFAGLLAIPKIIFFYVQLLFFPYNLNARHSFSFEIMNQTILYWPLFIFLVLVLIIKMRHNKQLIFGCIWFCVGLLPVLNIVPLRGLLVSERFMFFPSIGIAVAICSLLPKDKFFEFSRHFWDKLKYVLLTAICLNNLIFTMNRIPVWHNEKTFFQKMAVQNPQSVLGHHNLGYIYYNEGNLVTAEREYRQALALNPNFAVSHASLGDIFYKQQRYKEALQEYSIYLQLMPNALNRKEALARIQRIKVIIGQEK